MRTRYKYLALFIFTIIMEGYSQTKEQNYIKTKVYTYTDNANNKSLDLVQYFDGLGRLSQSVQVGLTSQKEDLVTIHEYDIYGRESRVWLPATGGGTGNYTQPDDVKNKAKNAVFYNDTNPFSEFVYEDSPLDRRVEQYGPGQDWQSNWKSVRTYYLSNKGVNEVATKDAVFQDNKLANGTYVACGKITLNLVFTSKLNQTRICICILIHIFANRLQPEA